MLQTTGGIQACKAPQQHVQATHASAHTHITAMYVRPFSPPLLPQVPLQTWHPHACRLCTCHPTKGSVHTAYACICLRCSGLDSAVLGVGGACDWGWKWERESGTDKAAGQTQGDTKQWGSSMESSGKTMRLFSGYLPVMVYHPCDAVSTHGSAISSRWVSIHR